MWEDKDNGMEGKGDKCKTVRIKMTKVRPARVLTRSLARARARARLISLMNSTAAPLEWITPDLFRPSRVDYPSAGQLYPGSRGKKDYIYTPRTTRALFTESAIGCIVAGDYPRRNQITRFVRAYTSVYARTARESRLW